MNFLPENPWLRRGIIAGILVLGWLFVTVDDWSRDLTTNHAELADDAYPLLQDRLRLWSAEEAAAGVKMAATRIPSWSWIGDAVEGDTRLVTFERTSKLFRFKDDITVRIQSSINRPILSAVSESRVGVGDLGQNPRSLHLLFQELTVILEPNEQSARNPVLTPPEYIQR